jgi:hypothetical protein
MGFAVGLLSRFLLGSNIWLFGTEVIGAGLVVYLGVSLALGAPEPPAVWALVTDRNRALARLKQNQGK